MFTCPHANTPLGQSERAFYVTELFYKYISTAQKEQNSTTFSCVLRQEYTIGCPIFVDA